MKIICSGGLGDAAMQNAKIQRILNFISRTCKCGTEPSITHIEHIDNSLQVIKAFWKHQGYDCTTIKVDSITDWWCANSHLFDITLGSHWAGQGEWKDQIEILPFPRLRFNRLNGPKKVAQVSSGRTGERKFSAQDLTKLVELGFCLIGKSDDSEIIDISEASGGLVNKTTPEEYFDILCSCKALFAHTGFAVYLSAMARARVFYIADVFSPHYIHPEWNTFCVGAWSPHDPFIRNYISKDSVVNDVRSHE